MSEVTQITSLDTIVSLAIDRFGNPLVVSQSGLEFASGALN